MMIVNIPSQQQKQKREHCLQRIMANKTAITVREIRSKQNKTHFNLGGGNLLSIVL